MKDIWHVLNVYLYKILKILSGKASNLANLALIRRPTERRANKINVCLKNEAFQKLSSHKFLFFCDIFSQIELTTHTGVKFPSDRCLFCIFSSLFYYIFRCRNCVFFIWKLSLTLRYSFFKFFFLFSLKTKKITKLVAIMVF